MPGETLHGPVWEAGDTKFMYTTVSISSLLSGGRQTVLSIAGICFAIILIFMQLGFLGAVLDTAVLFYDNLKFDLVVRSPDYYHFCDPKEVSRTYLSRIENVIGVEAVKPFHISLGRWSYAEHSVQRGMIIMGVDTNGLTFSSISSKVALPDLRLLTDDRSILVDEKSRPDFLGFDNSRRFSQRDIGLRIELNQAECEIAGLFKMGTGLAANGAAIINEAGYERIFPNYGTGRVALGLIQLRGESALDPTQARDAINRSLGFDPGISAPPVEILTRAEAIGRERIHWLSNTPVGFIFLAGVLMSFIVGAIIVYIILSTDISRQIGEYATLKAMGYTNGFLNRVVLEQAFILGMVSYLVSFVVSLFLYRIVGEAANLPITMTAGRQLVVFISSMLMCCLSAVIAMQKLRRADPADLF